MLNLTLISEFLEHLQNAIRTADPELAAELRDSPPFDLTVPFMFEYLDRLIETLSARVASSNGSLDRSPLAATAARVVCCLIVIRAKLAEEWCGH